MKRSTQLGLALLTLLTINSASATVISSESDPALTGATLLNFESGPAGTWTSHAFGGVTISAPGGSFSVDSDYAGSYNTRGTYHITNHGSSFNSLRFDFDGSVSAFGFMFGASDVNWTLSAYSASNALLDSMVVTPTGGSNAGNYFGLAGLAGADYLTLTAANGYSDYVFVDNVRYAAGGDVPEPGVLSLLGAAGLAAALVRRRKA